MKVILVRIRYSRDALHTYGLQRHTMSSALTLARLSMWTRWWPVSWACLRPSLERGGSWGFPPADLAIWAQPFWSRSCRSPWRKMYTDMVQVGPQFYDTAVSIKFLCTLLSKIWQFENFTNLEVLFAGQKSLMKLWNRNSKRLCIVSIHTSHGTSPWWSEWNYVVFPHQRGAWGMRMRKDDDIFEKNYVVKSRIRVSASGSSITTLDPLIVVIAPPHRFEFFTGCNNWHVNFLNTNRRQLDLITQLSSHFDFHCLWVVPTPTTRIVHHHTRPRIDLVSKMYSKTKKNCENKRNKNDRGRFFQ